MEIKARLNYFKVSPRKIRIAADLLVGLPAAAAIKQLRFSSKKSAPALVKLLKSAISNAKHNFHLEPENLFVKEFRVDEGPVLKRYMPRARGRASLIKKRSSHITVLLSDLKTRKSKSKKI